MTVHVLYDTDPVSTLHSAATHLKEWFFINVVVNGLM